MQISERQMHRFRWLLTIGWLLLILSLFYDPFSPGLTTPDNTISPLRIDPAICVNVQGTCIEESPYALGSPIFWGIIVPTSIFILLVFGHELWRRICPLSFLSQIPRALGWQRKQRRVHPQTGKVRYQGVKVAQNSWLGRNHLYLQFGLFYLGLCSRILFVNSNRTALAIFLLTTIIGAIVVGYLYEGKSWCQYFCPMAPVQKIYAEPRGLLTRTAHEEDRQKITQSMCRTLNKKGEEQSACVACQSPCIDIDAERSYWETIMQPQQQWLYYGYVGLVLGYFIYYYLYAGNWDYYFSGVWAHQENQLATLMSPGFYLGNQPIPLPKLVAVPLTLAAFAFAGSSMGISIEKRYNAVQRRQQQPLSKELIRHRMFTLCTFFVFNLFFVFAGRNFIRLLPAPIQYLFPLLIAICSTLWLYRTWQRHPQRYRQESLASRLRRQLSKLNLDISRFLEGRSLDSLNADEVYVLAKVLPNFTKEKRLQAYKGILTEALNEGYADVSSSLNSLQPMRRELDISEAEHQEILTELGVKNPNLLDPQNHRSREDWWRQESYREAMLTLILEFSQNHPEQHLVTELAEVINGKKPMTDLETLLKQLSKRESRSIEQTRQDYGVTTTEEAEIIKQTDPHQLWRMMSHSFDSFKHLDEDERLMAYFRLLDKDESGYISGKELEVCLREINSQVTHAEIEAMLKLADTNRDRQISYEEFREVLHLLD